MQQIKADLEANLERFKDPIVLGEISYQLLQERENTNRLLKNIHQKLEALEAGMPNTSTTTSSPMQVTPKDLEMMLPEVDEGIMQFARKNMKVTADDVQKEFNYKGKNGACARLNRLCDMNLLDKRQVGKKVFFFPKS